MEIKKRIVKVCPLCKKETPIVVKEEDYISWNNGVIIQKVFPYLTATQRETLITGMCKCCQDKLYGY